eukprot:scaffold1277_cov253-Pinguiococcus_pyrenoidosus.AAC.48
MLAHKTVALAALLSAAVAFQPRRYCAGLQPRRPSQPDLASLLPRQIPHGHDGRQDAHHRGQLEDESANQAGSCLAGYVRRRNDERHLWCRGAQRRFIGVPLGSRTSNGCNRSVSI